MITVTIFKNGDKLRGFSVTDHSDFSQDGADIVCSAVSSAVQLTANGVTEVAGATADVHVDEEAAIITLKTDSDDRAVQMLIKSFSLHMEILSEDYEENIKYSILEV